VTRYFDKNILKILELIFLGYEKENEPQLFSISVYGKKKDKTETSVSDDVENV